MKLIEIGAPEDHLKVSCRAAYHFASLFGMSFLEKLSDKWTPWRTKFLSYIELWISKVM